jgi:hypothetical protein
VLIPSNISVPSPLRIFYHTTARRNAAHAINVLGQRRSDRVEAERFMAHHNARQRTAVD